MTNGIIFAPEKSRFVRNSKKRTQLITNLVFLAFVAALVFCARPAQAANLLVNPGFESNSGHAIPVGWTRFAPPTAQPAGNYWIESVTNIAHSGILYFKEWGAAYNGTNNVAGIYQDLSSAPGSTFQASGWFYTKSTDVLGADCYVWMEVSFLGASTNLLALYKSANFNAAGGTDAWVQYQITSA